MGTEKQGLGWDGGYQAFWEREEDTKKEEKKERE